MSVTHQIHDRNKDVSSQSLLLFVVIVATEICIYCLNLNCTAIAVHEVQPGDRRTDTRTERAS